MNFNKLVIHGLGAMSVFIEIIFTEAIFFSIFIIFQILVSIFILGLKFFTELAVPGWTTTVLIGVFIAILNNYYHYDLFFMVLSYRSSKLFIPAKMPLNLRKENQGN